MGEGAGSAGVGARSVDACAGVDAGVGTVGTVAVAAHTAAHTDTAVAVYGVHQCGVVRLGARAVSPSSGCTPPPCGSGALSSCLCRAQGSRRRNRSHTPRLHTIIQHHVVSFIALCCGYSFFLGTRNKISACV